MKLNSTICVFGMKVRKFLRFMISKNGIELNLKELKALTSMSLPKTLKEAQVLTGWIATLNRFISKMAKKCLLFFKSLHNITNFEWTYECQSAFKDFKMYLESP